MEPCHEPESGTQFHFVGSSLMDAQGRRLPDPFIPAVHGESTAGLALSLIDVHPTRWTGGATSTVDGICLAVAAGSPHLTDLDTAEVCRATLDLHGLRETFVGTWPYGGGILDPKTVPGGLRDHLIADLGGGARLLVEAGDIEHISRGRVQPQEYANAVFEFDAPRPYSELITSFVEPLRDLVALATRCRSYISRLHVARSVDDRFGWQLASAPYPRRGVQGTQAPRTLAVALSAVEDPAALIRRWFELSRRSRGCVLRGPSVCSG